MRWRKGKHVPGNTLAKAEEVASLYGVAKSTVYRWYENSLFDVEPTVLPSPSGNRDRLLFNRPAIAEQFERELLAPGDIIPDETRQRRSEALEVFRAG